MYDQIGNLKAVTDYYQTIISPSFRNLQRRRPSSLRNVLENMTFPLDLIETAVNIYIAAVKILIVHAF